MKLTKKQHTMLRRLRGERNLTLLALADEIGVTRPTITKVIKYNVNIQPQTVNKIKDWIINQCADLQ